MDDAHVRLNSAWDGRVSPLEICFSFRPRPPWLEQVACTLKDQSRQPGSLPDSQLSVPRIGVYCCIRLKRFEVVHEDGRMPHAREFLVFRCSAGPWLLTGLS